MNKIKTNNNTGHNTLKLSLRTDWLKAATVPLSTQEYKWVPALNIGFLLFLNLKVTVILKEMRSDELRHVFKRLPRVTTIFLEF